MFVQIGEGNSAIYLRVVEMVRHDRTAVWSPDKTDLLGIDVVLGFLVTMAPGGNPKMDSALSISPDASAVLTGTDRTAAVLAATPRGANPGVTAGLGFPKTLETGIGGGGPVPANLERTGPETDVELRLQLMQPRQRTTLWAYDRQTGTAVRWVESPRPGFTVDLDNGPRPLNCDIVEASGEPSSVVMHYQVQTRLSPCPTGSDRLVLSHRWQMTHDHDEDNYLTRIIDGEVIFNAAVMRAGAINPDSLRNQFIHPIPVGMRRKAPRVTLSSDGLTIRYHVEDTDPTITFDPGTSGCTRVQIAEQVVYFSPTSFLT